MAWIRYLILGGAGLIGLSLLTGAVVYGKSVPFAQQWPLYEALRNTSAIIFAVVGAWLAIIYPERLKLSFGKKEKDTSSNSNIRLLLTPAINSTFILVILLTVGIAVPILKKIPAVLEHVDFFRGASFVLLTSLTLWQIVIVVIAVVPIELLLNQASREEAHKKLDAHYGSRHQSL